MTEYEGYFLWGRDSQGKLSRTHHRPQSDPHLSPEDNEKRGWKSHQAARQYKDRNRLHGLIVLREEALPRHGQ